MLSTYDGIKLLQSAGAKITTQRVAIMKSLQGPAGDRKSVV